MGLLFALAIVAAAVLGVALFSHALRSDRSSRHGWLVVVPLLIVVSWLLETLIMG